MYKVSDLAAEYKKKLISADEAAAMVKDGDKIHFGLGCGSVVDIDKALAERAEELKNITIASTVSTERWQKPEDAGICRCCSMNFLISGRKKEMKLISRCFR